MAVASRQLVKKAKDHVEATRERLDGARNVLRSRGLLRALRERGARAREQGPLMPTLTLTTETLATLGVRRAHLVPIFTLEGRGLLEALLASRGFDMTRAVRVVELTSGEEFVFTQ